MTERERLLAVLKGETPDRVPWFADLGHWYRSQSGSQWNLFTVSNCTGEIVDLHREVRAGWYVEVGVLFDEYYEDGVAREKEMKDDTVVETYRTPDGEIHMTRKWNPVSCSWDITRRMVENPRDLQILMYAAERRRFRPRYENWQRIEETGGDVGLGFPGMPYTALGSLMSYYMGVENTIYAMYDEPELIEKYIRIYNERYMDVVEICCNSQAPHFIFSDNLSSDVQTPAIFRKYSYDLYRNIAERFHRAGKTVSAHLDGMLGGVIGMVAEAGIDVADACTPKPTGDLTPLEIRRQAGSRMILMGGISPTMWLPGTSEKEFVNHVREWLDLRKISPRLVQSAGDQVPPGTELKRIKLVYDIVEEYGRY